MDLNELLWAVEVELAALIPRPSDPRLGDWPVENPADAGCLQKAFLAVQEAREAASRLQAPAVAEDGWQPIETAPQDGTQVLAPCGYGFLDVLTYSDGAWRETSNLLRARHQPTVWQPLPAAPALRTGGSE